MNLVVRAEDIMTPRNLLEYRRNDVDAAAVASDMGFDAIPISRLDGKVLKFWSQADQQRVRICQKHHTVLPPVTKCTKTNGLKMYQGQFWANFRRGDSEKVSEPEADGRPFLAGVDGAPHRPPKYEPSC